MNSCAPAPPQGAAERTALRDEIDERIGTLSAQIHALEAELVNSVHEYERLGGTENSDYRSLSQWFSIRTKFTPGDSRRITMLASHLDRVPLLLALAGAGQISLGLLAAAARVTTPENEAMIADMVRTCTASQAMRVLSKYRDVRPPPPDAAKPGAGSDGPDPEPDYWWRSSTDTSGRGRIDAALDPVTAALMEQAWQSARADGERCAKDQPTPADRQQRRMDPNEIARRLAASMIDGAHGDGITAPNGERFAVQVTVDLLTLARVLGLEFDSSIPIGLGSQAFLALTGSHLSDTELATILCDADLQLLIHHAGVPLWMSKATRTFSRHQRRAMAHRAGGSACCEFPGCTQTRYLDAHHVIEYGRDGPTDIDNGLLLCNWHHTQLHRRGWHITSDGAQGFTFWSRQGPGARCLGSSVRGDHASGPAPDATQLPLQHGPPDAPPGIGPDSARSISGGGRLSFWALDSYVTSLLLAA